MGKGARKKLEARLTDVQASLRDLESARSALGEELHSELERHAEDAATMRREHDEFVASTRDALARSGEGLAEVRLGLDTATEEMSRLAAALRERHERSRALEARLQEARALEEVLETRALQAEATIIDLQAWLDEWRLVSSEELGAARGRERLAEDRLRTVQGQLTDALKRLRHAPAADPGDAEPAEPVGEDGVDESGPTSTSSDDRVLDAQGPGDSTTVREEAPDANPPASEPSSSPADAGPDPPGEELEQAGPPREDEETVSYEAVWDRFRHDAAPDPERGGPGT